MIKLLLWIVGMPEDTGKSGKREMSGIVAIFTVSLLLWSWPSFDGDQRKEIIDWLLTLSAGMLLTTFGFHSLIRQAGLRFGGRGSDIDLEKPEPPAPPAMPPDAEPEFEGDPPPPAPRGKV